MSKTFSSVGKPSDSFAAYFAQSMQSELTLPDAYTLRNLQRGDRHIRLYPSSMPACSFDTFVRALEYKAALHLFQRGVLPTATCNPMGDTYGGMGSLRHTVSQRYLGLNGRMIGDWECVSCGGKRKFSNNPKCPACGLLMEYQEMGLSLWSAGLGKKYKALSCKLDGVFIDDDESLWVIDYKFKTGNGVAPWARGKLPQPEHKTQIGIYVSLLRNVFKTSRLKNVKGSILLYVGFDELNLRDSTKWHVVRETVSKRQSDKMWETLHNVEIPKVDLANALADKSLQRFVLNDKVSLHNTVFSKLAAAHTCRDKEKCDFIVSSKKQKQALQEKAVAVFDKFAT